MINESPREVRAYWFFTPYTTPDKELLDLLKTEKHEVGLHVANDPYAELELLGNATGRKVTYYTIHGTERLIGRILWRRKHGQRKASVPEDFKLKSFHDFQTVSLDRLVCTHSRQVVLEEAERVLSNGEVLHSHPEWLFQRGRFNHRGPFYEELKIILDVDKELDTLTVHKKGFAKIAKYAEENEYLQDHAPTERFLEKLQDRGVDVFTFIERKWCCPIANPPKEWHKTEDNVALLQVGTYEDWWQAIGKKTRNMVRKAEKSGIKVEVVEPSEKLAEGIWQVYNETPIRQGRAFSHYGQTLDSVKAMVFSAQNSTFIGAFLDGELAGFIQLVYGDKIVVMNQILSLQKHWDKAVNNALVAKAIEVCASKKAQWIMYGRIGNHPSLDSFKENNGFRKFPLTRHYVPLTRKGRIATSLGLHRPAKDALPKSLKGPLIPLFNWISRTKMQIKAKLR
jgi:hypothetical protein